MTIRAIIFDFDGVVVDSELISNLALAEALSEIGLPTTLDDSLAYYMGRHWPDTVAAIRERWKFELPEDFRARIQRIAADRRAGAIEAVPGAIDFIRALPAIPRAIASSSSREWLATNLARLGIADAFGDHLYSAPECVDRGKPHPDIYLHAAAAIGADPAETLAIEDTPTGAAAALAAGMTVIGLCAGAHCRADHAGMLRAAGVHHVAPDYAAVAEIFARVRGTAAPRD